MFEELPLEFSAIYETKPNNTVGIARKNYLFWWFITDSILLKERIVLKRTLSYALAATLILRELPILLLAMKRAVASLVNISIDSGIDTGSIYA